MLARTSVVFLAGLALAASQVTAQSSAGDLEFTGCNPGAQYPLSVHSIRVSPSPPKFGAPVKVTAVGDLSSTVSQGARAIITAKLGPFTQSREFNICSGSANSKLACPIAPGSNKRISITADLPDIPLRDENVELNVQLVNSDETTLVCLNTNVVIA
ncbi:MD-2-related lipid-recognition domain-containing protein [Thamnocephalis sphaerospora]|uniref:Phosphatidylglycerol/phosphatidylinositol transfer protein n=1 Tax=Thamnocephalis sphaerospora TaxID=78915 RepID=A0A4V1IX05_9FUNG|nr:MD-2-related lipid-recognition domain-containing protein [Thamnocephalis sphaerospora]|eukprot:RKP09379.1 MD-2-related lipid-recognition domain-containing protein [Thamnocephalis sphaerospora]